MHDEPPYDSWATIYDELYTNLFGNIYDSMTDANLRLIPTANSKVLDVVRDRRGRHRKRDRLPMHEALMCMP